jgi:hypothetical protein
MNDGNTVASEIMARNRKDSNWDRHTQIMLIAMILLDGEVNYVCDVRVLREYVAEAIRSGRATIFWPNERLVKSIDCGRVVWCDEE